MAFIDTTMNANRHVRMLDDCVMSFFDESSTNGYYFQQNIAGSHRANAINE